MGPDFLFKSNHLIRYLCKIGLYGGHFGLSYDFSKHNNDAVFSETLLPHK
jgi:hypothetical protein